MGFKVEFYKDIKGILYDFDSDRKLSQRRVFREDLPDLDFVPYVGLSIYCNLPAGEFEEEIKSIWYEMLPGGGGVFHCEARSIEVSGTSEAEVNKDAKNLIKEFVDKGWKNYK